MINPKMPLIKIQGIKNCAIYYIICKIVWRGTHFEPQEAIFSDTYPYITQFYKNIQDKKITSKIVENHLEEEMIKLSIVK